MKLNTTKQVWVHQVMNKLMEQCIYTTLIIQVSTSFFTDEQYLRNRDGNLTGVQGGGVHTDASASDGVNFLCLVATLIVATLFYMV